jgi:hypothetical protein
VLRMAIRGGVEGGDSMRRACQASWAPRQKGAARTANTTPGTANVDRFKTALVPTTARQASCRVGVGKVGHGWSDATACKEGRMGKWASRKAGSVYSQ